MRLFENIFLLLGAIALFLYGLKILADGVSDLAGAKLTKIVRRATSNRFSGALAGTLVTSVAQSSVATNMIVIALVEKGVISFVCASAVIMGTNVGTTVTAQLVSLSRSSSFDVTAIGSLVAFLGFILTLKRGQICCSLGKAMLGFGFIFTGIELLTGAVERFKIYAWFTNLFFVENKLLLVLNGFILTAILQSSSVLTSVMVVLASLGLLDFESAIFLVLGANIGTCLPVIFATLSMSKESFKCALFNVVFNIFGCLLFFPLLCVWGEELTKIGLFSTPIVRAIANFHTFFNVAVTCVLLPFLKPFCNLVEKICEFLWSDRKRFKKQKRLFFFKNLLNTAKK